MTTKDQKDQLLESALVLASDLSLDIVLQRIIELAVKLTDARYGALGVVGPDGRLLDFITTGITPEERQAIGPLPIGEGQTISQPYIVAFMTEILDPQPGQRPERTQLQTSGCPAGSSHRSLGRGFCSKAGRL